jgi:hypothetical protein
MKEPIRCAIQLGHQLCGLLPCSGSDGWQRKRPVMWRFSGAGMPSLSMRSGGRRPKSAKREIAVGGALAVPRALVRCRLLGE